MNELVVLQDIPRMHLCAVCPIPGHCCKKFPIWGQGELQFAKDTWKEEATDFMQSKGLPFLPLEVRRESSLDKVNVLFWCPKLTAEGKCSIYSTRPNTCRIFVPGSDPLCCFGRIVE